MFARLTTGITQGRIGRTTFIIGLSVLALMLALALSGCGARNSAENEYPPVGSEPTVAEPVVLPKWPYTGLDAESLELTQRRPLSVKIENHTAARPQTGLNEADVVYETIAEGGITRFNCIFHSNVPSRLGPVRSGRLSDMWIVPQYDGLFFFSGANGQVLDRVAADKLDDMSHDAAASLYSRSSDRSAPHNLYLTTDTVYDLAQRKGYPVTAQLEPLAFAPTESIATTVTASSVKVPISNYVTVNWKWDADNAVFNRFHYDVAHKDSTGKQVTAKNVVIIWAKYTPQSKLNKGSVTYDITLGGTTGKASLFIGGQRIDGTWEAERNAPPVFKDASGNPILLNPGNTWVEAIPLDIKITVL